jgi:8-oxo-dGTP pyrophosphatase MutT (NUDIX family)
MPISDYIRSIRSRIGTDLLFGVGVAAVIFNDAGEVLLQLRSDTKDWGLPGGALDPGEQPADGVVREVWEETGLLVTPERVVSVMSGKDHHFYYPNGDEALIVSITFACRVLSGSLAMNDGESLELRFFPPDALPEDMPERAKYRVKMAAQNDPRTFYRITE